MNIKEPLVSIIMPAYNAGKFIHEAIDSVIRQQYQNWELLITNDGSKDDTEEQIRSFSDKRIRLFSQENRGVSAARNLCLVQMEGDYFTFLDADDLLPPESISVRVSYALRQSSADIIAGAVLFFEPNGKGKTWQPRFSGNPLQAFIRIDETAFGNPALFIKRKGGITYSFKEGMTHVEDLLFFAFVSSQQPHEYHSINNVVYYYRVLTGSAMTNLTGLEKGYWSFFDTVKQLPGAEKESLVYLKWRIIRIMILSYFAAKKLRAAVKVIPKIFSKHV